MKLTASRADKYLAQPPHDSLGALLFGPDRGLVQQRSRKLCAKFCDDPDDSFNVTILTADDLASDPARLADEMSALSLLGDTRLIRLRLDHEKQGAALSKLIARMDTDPQRCAARLVIEAGDMSPRSAIRKAFEAAKHFAALPCYALSGRALETLIKDKLAAIGTYGINISPDALRDWAPRLEGDHALVSNEIEKMALYKGYGEIEHAEIDLIDVKQLAAGAGSATIDNIIHSAFSGLASDCDAHFRRAIAGKIQPALIIRSLQRYALRLHEALTQSDNGKNFTEAMKSLRPPVFIMHQRQFSQHMRQWNLTKLDRILSETLSADKHLKQAGSAGEAITGRLLTAISIMAGR